MIFDQFQPFNSPRTLERKISDDPFADHDFEIKIDMDLSTTSKLLALFYNFYFLMISLFLVRHFFTNVVKYCSIDVLT